MLPKALFRELGRLGRGGGTRAVAIVTTVLGTVTGYAVGRFLGGVVVAAPAPVATPTQTVGAP